MITNEELDVFTAALWAKHGDDLPRYVEMRLLAFAAAGDAGGEAFWRDIGERVLAMYFATRQ